MKKNLLFSSIFVTIIFTMSSCSSQQEKMTQEINSLEKTLYADPAMKIAEFSLMIYNRWGEMVFSSNEPTKGWDGSDSPAGIYAFVVQLTCSNKKNSYVSGSISLIR